jgi:hypothetical protein
MNRATNRSGRWTDANSERRRNVVNQFSQFQRPSRRGTSTSNRAVQLLASQGDAGTDPSQHATSADRLDSWKEIASYLGREVRTVQRWEKRESLPVHRHLHQKIGSVYAFKTEIDKWRDNRSLRSDPRAVRSGALLSSQIENQIMKPCNTNNLLSQRRNANSVHSIIFITARLPVRPKELQSLHLCKLLTCGLPATSRRAVGLPGCLCRSRKTTSGQLRDGKLPLCTVHAATPPVLTPRGSKAQCRRRPRAFCDVLCAITLPEHTGSVAV